MMMQRLNWPLLGYGLLAPALLLGAVAGIATFADESASPTPLAQGRVGAEDEFLRILPLPDGVEDIAPIAGAKNIPFKECSAVWPDGYRAYLAEGVAAEGHANRRDIYGWLRTKHAFDTKDCTCAGKAPAWEQVDAIYAELERKYGVVLLKHTANYEEQARLYRAAVERMCGGSF